MSGAAFGTGLSDHSLDSLEQNAYLSTMYYVRNLADDRYLHFNGLRLTPFQKWK